MNAVPAENELYVCGHGPLEKIKSNVVRNFYLKKTNKSISWKGILAHVGYEGPVPTLFFRQEPVLQNLLRP